MAKGLLRTLGAASLMLGMSLAPAFAGATLKGKITLDGAAPVDKEIKMSADPNCEAAHKGTPAVNDNYTVNADKTIHNVFVWVEGDAIKGKTFPTPTAAVQFDQSGCQYTPKVTGVMVNQPFEILNSDPTLHNVHALPTKSKEFNIGMPTKGMKVPKTFTAAERMVKIKCDVHPWMFAYVAVMDHPFYSATGKTGTFEIKDLPAGKYTVYAWHKKYADTTPVTMEIEVKDGETKTADLTMKPPAKAE